MPELPEVEVVKRSLEKVLKNLVIKKVKINNNRLRYLINKFTIFFLSDFLTTSTSGNSGI